MMDGLKDWVAENVNHSYQLSDYEKINKMGKTQLYNSFVDKIEIGEMEVFFNDKNQAVLSISGVDLVSRGNWKHESFLLKSRGMVQSSVSDAHIYLWYLEPIEIAGLPYINPKLNCTVTIAKLDMKFEGRNAVLFNLIKPLFRKFHQTQSQEIICAEAVRLLDGYLKDSIEKLRLKFEIFDGMIGYPLTGSPILTSNGGVRTVHLGQFLGEENEDPSSRMTPIFADESFPQHKMVRYEIHQYLFNQIFQHAYERHALQLVVSGENFPELSSNLATNCEQFCFGDSIPSLSVKYPNSSVVILLKMTDKPRIKIEKDLVELHITGKIDFNVKQPSNHSDHLFTVLADCVYEMELEATNEGEIGLISLDDTHLQVKQVKMSKKFDVKVPDIQLIGILNGLQGAVLRSSIENIARNIYIPLPKFSRNYFVNITLNSFVRTLILEADVL